MPWQTTRRKSGREYVTPVESQRADDGTIYVFASKAGAPSNPDWYYNLVAAGAGSVEVGTDTYAVTVDELMGDDCDRVYEEQARRLPQFAEYAEQTAGIRTIPVLGLRRPHRHTSSCSTSPPTSSARSMKEAGRS